MNNAARNINVNNFTKYYQVKVLLFAFMRLKPLMCTNVHNVGGLLFTSTVPARVGIYLKGEKIGHDRNVYL